MKNRAFLFALPLLSLAFACAPAGSAESEEAPESAESELAATGRGLLALDHSGYALSAPNLSRDLAASVGPTFVSNGVVSIPGVLKATSSTSPYAYAATLELSAWAMVSTSSPDGDVGTSLRVRIEGRTARAVYDAMTKITPVAENGAMVRRSPHGSAWCASYGTSHQCFLGPFGTVQSR